MYIRLILAIFCLLPLSGAHAEDESARATEQAAELARQQTTQVRRKATRDCYKELQAKPLAGRARHEFMQGCIADRQKEKAPG